MSWILAGARAWVGPAQAVDTAATSARVPRRIRDESVNRPQNPTTHMVKLRDVFQVLNSMTWNVKFGRNAWFLATGEVETAAHARARGQVGGQPFDSVMHLLCVTFKNWQVLEWAFDWLLHVWLNPAAEVFWTQEPKQEVIPFSILQWYPFEKQWSSTKLYRLISTQIWSLLVLKIYSVIHSNI